MSDIKTMSDAELEAELDARERRAYAADKRRRLEHRLEYRRRTDAGLCGLCGKKSGLHWCPPWFSGKVGT